MEEKEHKELNPENNDDSQGRTERMSRAQNTRHAQVPPSLLPVVLQRLGLSGEMAEPELAVDTLIEQLHSEDWEVRLNAVRVLGRLGSSVPVELLTSVLDDDDASVRAAALSALGNVGHHAPLHLLVTALNDRDWHVREVAALALGKQGERVPREALQIALHDSDSSVREAAMIALRWHRTTGELENTAVSEGQRWEQQIMQEKERHQNGQSTRSLSDEDWSGMFSSPLYESDTGRPQRVLHEQQQAYAAQSSFQDRQWQSYTPQEPESGGQMQMFAPDEAFSNEQVQEEWQREPEPSYREYNRAPSAHGEKVTSLPRQRPRRAPVRWILLIVMIAILFFVLGGMVFQRTKTSGSISTEAIHQGLGKGSFSESGKQLPFDPSLDKMLLDPKISSLARQEIAKGLNLSPDDISQQLQAGQGIQDIATAQGVSQDQLHTIELNAFTDLVKRHVETGNMSDKEGQGLIQQLQDNPDVLDKLTMTLFTIAPGAPAAPSKPGM